MTSDSDGKPPTASSAELLVEEGSKKSGLVWVSRQAVWHLWTGGSAYVVCGPGEQPAPEGLAAGRVVEVRVRSKDKGGRLVTWSGRVEAVAAGTAEWDAVVGEMRGKRLNAVDADGIGERWARECTLFRITPEGVPGEYPGAMPDGSGAAVPVASPATTREPMPAGLPKLLARRNRKQKQK